MQNATGATDGQQMGHAKCRTRLPVDAEPVLTFEPQHLYIRANVGVPLINGLWRALFCQKEQMFFCGRDAGCQT